jgi:hypothetical protein
MHCAIYSLLQFIEPDKQTLYDKADGKNRKNFMLLSEFHHE